MEKIKPVEHLNYIVKPNKNVEKIRVVTEIGIFGISIV